MQIDFMGKKYIWFTISAIAIVVSIIALITKGLNFGVDFTGGTQVDFRCKKGTTIKDVRKVFAKFNLGDAQIQQAKGGYFIVRTPNISENEREKIVTELKKSAGLEEVLGVTDVGPGWGAQVSRRAAFGVIVFIFAVILYVSIRFEFKMAVCAVVEIIHDVVITVGVYALSGREVTPATIIAFLTILGYSLYDAIVIFDRLKENADRLSRESKKTYTDTVNDSINQVLARSINTSLTTLFPIITILLFGGETLKAFAFALFLGVFVGTYSSIFVASPILALWKESEPKYRAYRERLEKAQRKTERAKGKPAPEVISGGGQREGERRKEPQKVPSKEQVKPSIKPKEVKAQSAEEKEAQPKPTPRPKQKSSSSAKSAAKARTKGPSGGKKKKKKR